MKKEMMKAIIAILLQLPLIVLTKDLALNESNNRDNKTQMDLTLDGAKQANSTESTTLPMLIGNSTITGGFDRNSTESVNGTLRIDTTIEPITTTPDPQELLIPPATVEAQIVKANISSKKPSRLQAAA